MVGYSDSVNCRLLIFSWFSALVKLVGIFDTLGVLHCTCMYMYIIFGSCLDGTHLQYTHVRM